MSLATLPVHAPVQSSTPAAPKPARLRAPRGGITLDGRHYPGGRFLPASAAPALEDLAARAARRSVAEPVVIGIQGFSYRVEALPIDPSIGTHAFSVRDLDRARIYTVHRSAEGEVVCDCGDFTWRKAGTGVPCKHGRELLALGLIPTRPTVLPPFAQRDQQQLTTPLGSSSPDQQTITTPLGCSSEKLTVGTVAGHSTAAAIAGFERWAADRMAGVKGPAVVSTLAESWRVRGERLGRSGRLVDLEVAYPDATPREVLLYALDYSEAQWLGFRDFARQLGYAAGLDGGPGDRPESIPRRFDDAWVAGFEAGDLERRERDRIQAEWQREAEEEEMERWAREEALEARGYYRAELARA